MRSVKRREYERQWREQNQKHINALARERERKKKRDALFAEYGFYEVPDGMKQCHMCKKVKCLDEFYTRKPTKMCKSTHRTWCKQCDGEVNSGYRKTNPSYFKNWKLKKNFGITLAEYEAMCEQQHNQCAICGREPRETTMKYGLAVDHCHETGVVRGLLCNDCNIGLGKLGDNVHGVQRALDYLLRVRSE